MFKLIQLYHDYGSTLGTRPFGLFTMHSIRPENLQTIFVLNSNIGVCNLFDSHFRILSVVLASSLQMVQYARASPKPSFNRAHTTDLPILENHLRFLIYRIPKDRFAVDLQPLFIKAGFTDLEYNSEGAKDFGATAVARLFL